VSPAVAAEVRDRASHERYLEWWVAEELSAVRGTPFTGREDVAAVARQWSDHLIAAGRLEHNPDYGSQFCCWQKAGEILAMIPVDASYDEAALRSTARSALHAWMNSAPHRAVALDPAYDDLGVGVSLDYANGRAWITVNFRDRNGADTPGGVTYQPGTAPPSAPHAGPPCGGDGDPWGEPAYAPDRSSLDRIAGEDRVATALALAADVSRPEVVLLASAANYADSLAAAGLAGATAAPVVLSAPDRLDPRVRDQLRAWEPREIVLLGGGGALSETVAQDARRAVGSAKVTRLQGANRYETAAAVTARLAASGGNTGRVIVALGTHPDPDRSWPDAVTVSGIAASHRHPVVLALPGGLPEASRAALRSLKPSEVIVVGGPASVSESVLEHARAAAPGATVRRVSGPTRYDTSMAVLQVDQSWRGAPSTRLEITSGADWPDALAAGPAAARRGAVLLMINGEDGPSAREARIDLVQQLVATHWRLNVTIVGGDGAVSPTRAAQIRSSLPCL
jgi:putative cell wall-binding protein